MAAQGFLLIATFLLVLMVLARPLGSGLARLINDIPLPGTTGVERVLFRALGVSDREMNWKQYLCAILGLNMLGLAVLFFMLLGQHYLPLNPQQLPGLSWDLALNTAVSFVTNTNWQSYSGETTLSYFSQMAGLTVQNFLSAASGIAVIFALIRAFTRQSMSTLGNAWVDLLRITLWVLVPVALLIALFFIQQGALQNFQPYQAVNTVEGAQQLLPMGPVASQEAIKMLGTNGGGFFNANSSHPFENPTALTNFVQMLAIFLIPTALCFAFGEVTGDRRQGRMLLWAMSVIFVICVGVVMWAEVQGNPHLLALGTDSSINMEGKESRFGVLVSSLFAVVTTAASCGAVIAMHDSFTALGGMVPMWLMQIGEVVFGGVGSGLYGMMLFVLLAVFIAGLMIGRTPEYLGKKIEGREMKLTALCIIIHPFLILAFSALAVGTQAGLEGITNPGFHGLSQVLYEFSSSAANNGSGFEGLADNTMFWNITTGLAMFFGRYLSIVIQLAIAGSFMKKKFVNDSVGSLHTDTATFPIILVVVVYIFAALTFFPVLALGPIAEHLTLWA